MQRGALRSPDRLSSASGVARRTRVVIGGTLVCGGPGMRAHRIRRVPYACGMRSGGGGDGLGGCWTRRARARVDSCVRRGGGQGEARVRVRG